MGSSSVSPLRHRSTSKFAEISRACGSRSVRYGRPANASTTSAVEVTLTDKGAEAVALLCPNVGGTVRAKEFAIDETRAVLKGVKGCNGADISIPKSGVAGTKTT